MTEINGLSEREIEILKLVATGATNKEIAGTLFISVNTVKVHLRNIFGKIGVESRTEAAMWVVKAGLLPEQAGQDSGSAEEDTQTEVLLAASADGDNLNREENRRFSALLRRNRGAVILGVVFLVLAAAGIIAAWTSGLLRPVNTVTDLEDSRWAFAPDLKSAREGLAAANVDDLIYAIGGEGDAGVIDLVERFDPAEMRWELRQKKPTATADISAVAVGGKIYVPGGRLAEGKVSDRLEIYDPRLDTWAQGARLPVGVSAYGLAAMDGKIYLFGGWDGEIFSNQTLEYDPSLDRWKTKTPMKIGRGYFGTAVVGGKVYLIGGTDGKRSLDLVESYSPSLDDGATDPWGRVKVLPNERAGIGAVGIADYVYVLGRDQESGQATALIYTPQLDQWSEFETPVELPWSRMGVLSLGNKIYALGGLIDGMPSTQNLAYQAVFTILLPVIR